MNIKLKSLHLENFKGIKVLDVFFSNKTKIKGQNASGKTTVFDSFTWLLFNKNSAGEEKFNVRPLDAEGKRVDNVEIKVVAVLEVDGREVELSKVQRQKWVKKRGTSVTELQGNENLFEIDGYPKSEKDYKAYISGLVDEELFKMLTNPQFFSGMKWKEQRDILMKFVSTVSDVELAKENPEFSELVSELEKAPSTDDIHKKFSKALTEWKKKQAEIPVRIDELSKSLEQIDVAEQELAKTDLERRISELDDKIANSNNIVGDLISESMQLQMDMSAIMQDMNRELSHKRNNAEGSIFDSKVELEKVKDTISKKEKYICEAESCIETAEKRRADLGREYKEVTAKAFDETPYQFDDAKWVFDENSTICSLCGQVLPLAKIDEIKADFEVRKVKAKTDAENSLKFAREQFAAQKKSKLKAIENAGFEQKNLIETMKSKIEDTQNEINYLKKQEQEVSLNLSDLEKQLSEIPKEADYYQNEEYEKLKVRYDEVSSEIEKLKSSTDTADIFKEKRKQLEAELDAVKGEIAKASKNVEIEERIGALEEEQREVGQKVADQEKMLYLLDKFIQMKMDMISEEINKHFKYVSFKLFEEQYNGGITPTCKIKYVKESRGDLNNGHRIIAGLDIIQSLSELYGVTAPIFVDNAESLNEYNVPNMVSQMILLAVSDDKELKVEVQ